MLVYNVFVVGKSIFVNLVDFVCVEPFDMTVTEEFVK